MINQALRASARLWYSQMLQAAPSTPNPRNSPQVRVGDGPADRVLLLGNGVLHGWGVHLREMSVPGHLAQLLQEGTGRAALVDYVGDERMNAASAAAWLGDAAQRGHDVVVVALGLNDALRLEPLAGWTAHVGALLQQVLEEQEEAARVLVVGLPRVRAFAMADSAMGSMAQRHADRMDEALQELAAADDRITFVPAPVERFERGRELGSSAMYRDWAAQLLQAVLPAVEAVRAVKPVAPDPAEAWDWTGAPVLLEDGTDLQHRLEAISDAAKERFGVASAGVNLMDGDRVHSVTGAGGARTMPRSLAYCDLTVQRDETTVVPDAALDPRWADNPLIDLIGLPFYAGVPLHATDGRPVATFCVMDDEPRDDVDPVELERYARMAERELQRLDGAGRTAPARADADPADPAVPGVDAAVDAPVAEDPETSPLHLRALAQLLRPAVVVALQVYLRRQSRPHWDERAIAPGPDLLRVLVVGAGLAVGYGGDDGARSLPAEIAAALSAATGRGVVVETRAQASVPLEATLPLLGRAGTATFDHVVWSPTLEEAVRGSSRRWGRQLRRIVRGMQDTGSEDLGIVLMGLPLVQGDHVLQRLGRVFARRVNEQIAAVAAASERTGFLPMPSRSVPTLDTPLFDAAYRVAATERLVHHVLARRTEPEAGPLPVPA